MEQATVISIVPFPIQESKPGVFPSLWKIPAAKSGEIEVLPVGEVTTWEYIDEQRGSRKIIIKPLEFANSLVWDYISSMMAYNENAHPGLQAVLGDFTKERAKKDLTAVIETLRRKQDRWFEAIVKAADDTWQETHQYQHISDIQRQAAKSLNLAREWVFTAADMQTKQCTACYSVIDARASVCRFCQTKLEVK